MRKQAHWKRQAFLAGFLDGFGGFGQLGSPLPPAKKPVTIRLASGVEVTPLEMVRRKAARLRWEARTQGTR